MLGRRTESSLGYVVRADVVGVKGGEKQADDKEIVILVKLRHVSRSWIKWRFEDFRWPRV